MDGVEYLRRLRGAFGGFWWCFWLDFSQMTSFFLFFVGDVSHFSNALARWVPEFFGASC